MRDFIKGMNFSNADECVNSSLENELNAKFPQIRTIVSFICVDNCVIKLKITLKSKSEYKYKGTYEVDIVKNGNIDVMIDNILSPIEMLNDVITCLTEKSEDIRVLNNTIKGYLEKTNISYGVVFMYNIEDEVLDIDSEYILIGIKPETFVNMKNFACFNSTDEAINIINAKTELNNVRKYADTMQLLKNIHMTVFGQACNLGKVKLQDRLHGIFDKVAVDEVSNIMYCCDNEALCLAYDLTNSEYTA